MGRSRRNQHGHGDLEGNEDRMLRQLIRRNQTYGQRVEDIMDECLRFYQTGSGEYVPAPEIRVGLSLENHITVMGNRFWMPEKPYTVEIPEGLSDNDMKRTVAHKTMHIVQAIRQENTERFRKVVDTVYRSVHGRLVAGNEPYPFKDVQSRRALMEASAMLFAESFATLGMDGESRIYRITNMLGGGADHRGMALWNASGMLNGESLECIYDVRGFGMEARLASLGDAFMKAGTEDDMLFHSLLHGICSALGFYGAAAEREANKLREIAIVEVPKALALVALGLSEGNVDDALRMLNARGSSSLVRYFLKEIRDEEEIDYINDAIDSFAGIGYE